MINPVQLTAANVRIEDRMVSRKSRSKSSNRWLQEHHSDAYVARARADNYRSRAVYKLIELDTRYGLLKPGMSVVELGAAPGSWTQYVAEKVGDNGTVIASDILPMDSFAQVRFIQGDFRETDVFERIVDALAGRPADLVLSDMAPNISGVPVSDQARSMYLAELAHDMATHVAGPGSTLVMKLFQGQGFNELINALRNDYTTVNVRKPDASRDRSREVFAVARNLLMV